MSNTFHLAQQIYGCGMNYTWRQSRRRAKHLLETTMSKPISFYFDSPAVREMQDRYGARWEGIDIVDRFRLIELLSASAGLAYVHGESKIEDLSGFFSFGDDALIDYVVALDTELPDIATAAQLIQGISETLSYARV